MKVQEIKGYAERQPFRPFAVRLNNGVQYTFSEPRNIGAPKDYHIIIFFGEPECVVPKLFLAYAGLRSHNFARS